MTLGPVKVRCIYRVWHHRTRLTVGREYDVLDVREGLVQIIDDRGTRTWWTIDEQFEPTETFREQYELC